MAALCQSVFIKGVMQKSFARVQGATAWGGVGRTVIQSEPLSGQGESPLLCCFIQAVMS